MRAMPLGFKKMQSIFFDTKRGEVRSAVFPVDFPYTALFIRMGVLPVDTLPLRRALAASPPG